MKIGITQRQVRINGRLYDCLDPQWYNLFPKHLVVPIPNILNIELDPGIDVIILAGDRTIHDEKANELMCFNHAVKHNLTLLAVGKSALYINYLHDGIDIPIENHVDIEHSVLMDGKVWNVNSDHDLGIYQLGPRLTQMAVAKDGSIEGFKHRFRPFWGLLWHPEQLKQVVLPAELLQILNNDS